MSIRTFARIGAAVALALGLLVATAAPASASATGVVIEGSSTVVFGTGTWFDRHFPTHPTTNVCAPNSTSPAPIPVAFDSSGGGTIGPTNTEWADIVIGTNNLKTRMVVVSGSMTLTATGLSVALVVRFEYRTCASTTLLCTTNNVAVTLIGSSVGLHPMTSARVTASGTSAPVTVAAVPACNPIIRAGIQNTTAAISLNLHFV